MMIIDTIYGVGESVFLKTDRDQYERIVTGICIRMNGIISYELVCGTMTTWHYEIELSKEKNILITTNH